jgi:hypothetical protein
VIGDDNTMMSVRTLARVSSCRPAVVAATAWLLVLAVVTLGGQGFSTSYLDYGWQLVPWDVLVDDPIGSVWYLHVQPPLWNLVLGVVARVSPFADALTLQVLMAAIGALLAAGCARLGRVLGLRRGAAVAVALVATLHPEVLKNAFEPTYELATATLLVWTIVAAVEATRGRHRACLAFVVVATAVVLTRSLYHPLWLAAMVAMVVVAGGVRGMTPRRVALLAMIPLIAVGGWMAKNAVLFDTPTLSSWFGMNLQRAVIPVLDADELRAMYDAGEVSDVAMVGPFGNFDLYRPYEPAASCTVERSHRAVSEPGRATDPYSPNFNYECYLPVFEQAGDDAWAVIRRHPDVWWEGRLWSARTMAAVSSLPAESASGVLVGLDAVYSLARVDVSGVISTTGWGTPIYGAIEARSDFGLVPIAMYALVAALGVVSALRILRRRSSSASDLLVALAGLTAGWTFVVGVVGELGEQARFRTMTDALVWTVAIAVVMRWFDAGQEQAASPGR